VSDHALLSGVPVRARIAHSRWNELPEAGAAIVAATDILTLSPEAGVDAFVKQRQKPVRVLQGPSRNMTSAPCCASIAATSDASLRGERESYPGLPRGYFDVVASDVLASFRHQALADRREGPAGKLSPRASWKRG